MKSERKVGLVEKILNSFGFYKPEVKKPRKTRTPRAKIHETNADSNAHYEMLIDRASI